MRGGNADYRRGPETVTNFETLMTSDEERLAYLNSLPPEPRPDFHDFLFARIDELVADGVHWEIAYDQAYDEVRQNLQNKTLIIGKAPDQEGA